MANNVVVYDATRRSDSFLSVICRCGAHVNFRPPLLHKDDTEPDKFLSFESRFESGNLRRAVAVGGGSF